MRVCLCVCVDSDHEVNWETRPIIRFRVQIARQYLILYEGIDWNTLFNFNKVTVATEVAREVSKF